MGIMEIGQLLLLSFVISIIRTISRHPADMARGTLGWTRPPMPGGSLVDELMSRTNPDGRRGEPVLGTISDLLAMQLPVHFDPVQELGSKVSVKQAA